MAKTLNTANSAALQHLVDLGKERHGGEPTTTELIGFALSYCANNAPDFKAISKRVPKLESATVVSPRYLTVSITEEQDYFTIYNKMLDVFGLSRVNISFLLKTCLQAYVEHLQGEAPRAAASENVDAAALALDCIERLTALAKGTDPAKNEKLQKILDELN